MQPEDTGGAFTLRLSLTAPTYGKLMQNCLLIFRPTAVLRGSPSPFVEAKRTHSLVLDPEAFTELTAVTLPPGFTVDELRSRSPSKPPLASSAPLTKPRTAPSWCDAH